MLSSAGCQIDLQTMGSPWLTSGQHLHRKVDSAFRHMQLIAHIQGQPLIPCLCLLPQTAPQHGPVPWAGRWWMHRQTPRCCHCCPAHACAHLSEQTCRAHPPQQCCINGVFCLGRPAAADTIMQVTSTTVSLRPHQCSLHKDCLCWPFSQCQHCWATCCSSCDRYESYLKCVCSLGKSCCSCLTSGFMAMPVAHTQAPKGISSSTSPSLWITVT